MKYMFSILILLGFIVVAALYTCMPFEAVSFLNFIVKPLIVALTTPFTITISVEVELGASTKIVFRGSSPSTTLLFAKSIGFVRT